MKASSHFSVRLACVRRAASVRPEPGSNSLLKLYNKCFRICYLILILAIARNYRFFSLFWLLLLNSWSFLTLRISRVVYFSFALFNFQDAVASHEAFLLYHISFNLSSTFFKFFQIFSRCSLLPFVQQLLYYITYFPICQVLFQVFSNFLFCDTLAFASFFQCVSLPIISLSNKFVNTFSKVFLKLPSTSFPWVQTSSPLTLVSRSLVRQLYHYIIISSVCQGKKLLDILRLFGIF